MLRFVTPRLIIASYIAAFAFAAPVLAQTSQTKPHLPAKATVKSPAKPTSAALPQVDLPTESGMYAVIYTSMGNIVCLLYDEQAPKTVENFRGLATGAKPWRDPRTGRMRHTPLYTKTTFHRVIPGFMIQGGDPTGEGSGEPGFKIKDEIDPTLTFSKTGVLAMANSGPNTNGCQFFITVGPADHLNGNYSIFGRVVSGQEVADNISKVPRDETNDKPKTPVVISAIAIKTVRPQKSKSLPPKE